MSDRQPINLQLRVTDSSWDNIKQAIGWNLTDKHLVFRHTPKSNPDNVHHHVYLFDIYRTAETLRNILRKRYEKTQFAVSVTAGRSKQKITPELAYQYALNPKSQPELVSAQGFTNEELEKFKKDGEDYYKPMEVTLVTKEEHYVVRPDRIWERLKMRQSEGVYDNMTLHQIKCKLAAEWLNAGKAMMRNADCHRYAVSIYMLNKYKHLPEIPDNAFREQYSISDDLL